MPMSIRHTITGTAKRPAWRRLMLAGSTVGSLFAFASPSSAAYPVASAQDMRQSAWNRVGAAMRGAMAAQREVVQAHPKRR